MTEIKTQLLELIAKEKTINEISQQLKLSHKQIYALLRTLKLHGIEFQREYFYDGNIKYIPQNKRVNTDRTGIDLITKNIDQQISIMLISDLHFGSKYDRIDLVFKIYDYCIKNNIHIIINAGDLIDGVNIGEEKKLKTFNEQIDFVIKNYPFDKNIINFVCLGNHDIDSFRSNNQDISSLLYNYRHDLVPLGYGLGNINIKNETIYVKHLISDYTTSFIPSESLILLGHSHKASLACNGNLYVHIPTLSDINNERCGFPGALLMTITFKNGYFKTGRFEQLIIDKNIFTVNEYTCELLTNRTFKRKNQTILEENDFGIYIKDFENNKQINVTLKDEPKKLSRKQKKRGCRKIK